MTLDQAGELLGLLVYQIQFSEAAFIAQPHASHPLRGSVNSAEQFKPLAPSLLLLAFFLCSTA